MQFYFSRSMYFTRCSPIDIPIDDWKNKKKGYELKCLPTAKMFLLDFLRRGL